MGDRTPIDTAQLRRDLMLPAGASEALASKIIDHLDALWDGLDSLTGSAALESDMEAMSDRVELIERRMADTDLPTDAIEKIAALEARLADVTRERDGLAIQDGHGTDLLTEEIEAHAATKAQLSQARRLLESLGWDLDNPGPFATDALEGPDLATPKEPEPTTESGGRDEHRRRPAPVGVVDEPPPAPAAPRLSQDPGDERGGEPLSKEPEPPADAQPEEESDE